MSRIYYKSAKAALICYGLSLALLQCHRLCAITLCCLSQNTDMTFAPSFKKVRFWADELKKQEPNCAIFVVGTKCLSISHTVFLCLFHSLKTHIQNIGDMVQNGSMPPAVRKEELRGFAMDMGLDESHFWETSAKTGANINDLFEAVALEYNGPEADDPSIVTPSAGTDADRTTQSGWCSC